MTFIRTCLTSILILSIVHYNAHAQSPAPKAQPHPTPHYDICIYGGTSAGVIAAYTAARMHQHVLLVEPGHHLGGLSSGGLGYTDIGNKYAISGLSLDFYRRIGRHYGKFEQWIFEPHVAEDIFQQYIREGNVKVIYGHRLTAVQKTNSTITGITLTPSDPSLTPATGSLTPSAGGKPVDILATFFIDCSYEGDLMAGAGVSYTVGREDNADFHETYDGVQLLDKHQFPDSVSPYKTPGDPSSGLLWGISAEPLAARGTGDKKVQSYNYRICLTNQASNRLPITRPDNYDAARYELLLRLLDKHPAKDLGAFLKFDILPGNKTDINNNGAFSSDMIGMNYDYPEADAATRAKIAKAHTDYCKGLLYFIGHDPRMPATLRTMMLEWGYPKDEYTDNDHWTTQLYVREARRMKGAYVMTQANCQGKETVTDGIGLAAYTMDSHNCQRIVVNGMVKNEGDVQIGGFPPYPIAYRSILPTTRECSNLLVPVCLSATHIAYGSIRMEPVFMELGQSAAIAASLAITSHMPLHTIDPAAITDKLKKDPLADGSTPEILIDNDDSAAVTIQGSWIRQQHESYGFSRLADEHKDQTPKSVRFTPRVAVPGNYALYVYVPKVQHPSTITQLTVSTPGRKKDIALPTGRLQVEGQTSGEWVAAGSIGLPSGNNSYIEISNRNADGTVIADAILLVPEKK